MDREDFPSDDDYMDAVADAQSRCRTCFDFFTNHSIVIDGQGRERTVCPD